MAVGRVRTGFSQRARIAFTLDGVSGNYANERITFGADSTGLADFAGIFEITCLVEGSNNAPFVPGCTVELWLRRGSDASESPGTFDDGDYTLAGATNFPSLAAAGAQVWGLSGFGAAQIRCKSGAMAGSQGVTATCL